MTHSGIGIREMRFAGRFVDENYQGYRYRQENYNVFYFVAMAKLGRNLERGHALKVQPTAHQEDQKMKRRQSIEGISTHSELSDAAAQSGETSKGRYNQYYSSVLPDGASIITTSTRSQYYRASMASTTDALVENAVKPYGMFDAGAETGSVKSSTSKTKGISVPLESGAAQPSTSTPKVISKWQRSKNRFKINRAAPKLKSGGGRTQSPHPQSPQTAAAVVPPESMKPKTQIISTKTVKLPEPTKLKLSEWTVINLMEQAVRNFIATS